MTSACISCGRLDKCKYATVDMVARERGCELWAALEFPVPTVRARLRIMELFSPSAILASPNPKKKSGEDQMEGAQRATLRKLAVSLGLVEASAKSFSIPRDTLIEKLSAKIPDIDSMSEAEVAKLIETGVATSTAKTAGKPSTVTTKPADEQAAPGPKKPGPKPGPRAAPVAPKEEPTVVEEEEVEEEVPEKPAGRGPAPRPSVPAPAGDAPAKRGPGRPPGPRPSSAPAVTQREETVSGEKSAPAANVDLGPVIDRIDAIGALVDKANKGNTANGVSIESLTKDVKELKATLASIAGYMTWQYNSDVGEGEQVESITKIDWS